MALEALYNNEQVKKPGFLVSSIQDCLRNIPADDVAFTDLVKSLKSVEACLGGKPKAFAIERKTRMFIDEILKHLFHRFNCDDFRNSGNCVYIEMEAELRLFSETIRPDYQLMLQTEGASDSPLFVLEVKRTDI